MNRRSLLAVPAGDNAVRLLPPLTASAAELAESADILGGVLAAWPRA